MKNWKDKVLGIFAGIGVMALLMGNYVQQPKGIWEMHITNHTSDDGVAYSINTETGEVRKYNKEALVLKSGSLYGSEGRGKYIVMKNYIQ